VWEDPNDRGFIVRDRAPGRGAVVSVFATGVEYVRSTANVAALTAGHDGDLHPDDYHDTLRAAGAPINVVNPNVLERRSARRPN
jgi:hypothetical protein